MAALAVPAPRDLMTTGLTFAAIIFSNKSVSDFRLTVSSTFIYFFILASAAVRIDISYAHFEMCQDENEAMLCLLVCIMVGNSVSVSSRYHRLCDVAMFMEA